MVRTDCLAGIFVGGHSRRMSGAPKGLLQPPGGTQCLVERLATALTAADLPEVLLVGCHDAYAQLALPCIPDAPHACGPMAGLLGLVERAAALEYEFVLALACDMPGVDTTILQRLHLERRDADALVPRRERWEPLCARYRVSAILPHLRRLICAGQFRMTGLLEALGRGCVALELDPAEACRLEDWDAPSDLPSGVCLRGVPYPGVNRP